jgi:hypothetical protein
MIAKSWFRRCWQWQIGGCVADVREDIGDKENFLILRELATSEY